MKRRGVHHVGLTTLDIDRTVEFYTNKLGFELAWADIIEPPEGGKIKHVFLDSGDGTFFAFMSPEKVPGIPQELATDINSAQNLPGIFYHFALWLDTTDELAAKRADLVGKGVEVTPVFDHEWCQSIYLRDPNGLLIEYCVTTRQFTAEDKTMRHHDQPGPVTKDPEEMRRAMALMMGPPPGVKDLGKSPV